MCQSLRAKYKVGNSWLQAPPVRAASFSWRGLESAKDLISNGACRKVGLGTNILVGGNSWIPNLPSFLPSPRDSSDTSQVIAKEQLMGAWECWLG